MAEHGRSGGPKPKDSAITGGFNRKKKGSLSKAELARIKREAAVREIVEAEKRKKGEGELERLLDRAAKLQRELGQDADVVPDVVDEPVEGDADVGDDDASSALMLRDLRWAYKKGIGKRALKEMMKDEKQRVSLIRELLRAELAYITAKLRAKDEGNRPDAQQAVFVVVKGLHDANLELEIAKGDVDLRQIQHALNPDGTEYEAH